jgi:release factor glutamine methyltransferase
MPADPKNWTIASLIAWATEDFRTKGIDTPKLDAEVLVSAALDLTRMQLILQHDRPLSPAELSQLRGLIKRRRQREPIAYLVGSKEFYGHKFRVSDAVLIPRPDTETLVDVALARSADIDLSARVLDLCTGSGCVAIALAKARRTTTVLGVDISQAALEVANANAAALGAYNVAFAHSDIFAGLAGQMFDVVVSNPPYIASAEIETLQPEIRTYEPKLALDGGADGLGFYRTICREAASYLAPGGVLALEVGAGQAHDVETMLAQAGYIEVQKARDLGRIERVVSARKAAAQDSGAA